MAAIFDFKKEYKELYLPKTTPEIVTVPPATFIAMRGRGDPNEEGGQYKAAVSVLYSLAYTIKMSNRGPYKIQGFFDYIVPPLEGFWWQEGARGVDYSNKQAFSWISAIRLPDFVRRSDFDWAKDEVWKKKKISCSAAEYLRIEEGLCVQALHIGPFDEEPATVAAMDRYIGERGYVNDFSATRLHHEIYLSDINKVAPEKWKTVVRHPVKKL